MRLRFPVSVELDALPALEEGAEQTNSSWAQVLRTGKFQLGPDRELDITTEMLDQMVENSKRYNEAPFDFDHLGTSGKGKAGDGKAAGWAKKWERRGDKLYAFVEWTAEAADLIRKKAYRYVSATFLPKFFDPEAKKDVGPRLLGAAITNYPFVTGMDPLSFAEIADISLTDREQRVASAWERRFNPMGDFAAGYITHFYDDYVLVKKDGKTWKQPFTMNDELAVDFPSEAVEVILTPQELSMSVTIEQFNALQNMVTSLTEKVTGSDARIAELSAGRVKDQEEIARLQVELEAAKQLGLTTAAERQVDALISEGKLLPKQRDWAVNYAKTDNTNFLAFAATLEPLIRFNREDGSGEGVTLASNVTRQKEDGPLENTDKRVVEFANKMTEYRKENPKADAAAAMAAVAEQHPTLFQAYRESFAEYTGDDSRVQ